MRPEHDLAAASIARCRPLLGTFVEVRVFAGRSEGVEDCRPAIDAAFDAVARVDARMSYHRADSDLSRLNAHASAEPIQVDAWTYDLLGEARRVFLASGGAFDCGVADVLVRRGILPGSARPASRRGSLADVHLLDDGRVALRRPVRLDFGGIAKGFAVDRAVDALRDRGVRSAVVNAGGDLRVLGLSARPVGVRDGDGAVSSGGWLADGAIATSSPYRAGAGRSPSALVRPSTGEIVASARTFSVVAPLCVHADALTKVLAVRSPPDARCFDAFDATAFVH